MKRFGGRALPLLVLTALVAVLLGAGLAQTDRVEAIGEPVVISEVDLAGADASITITNEGADAIDISGWFVCNFPAYWPIPAGTTLDAGASLEIHAGDGTDTADEIFAGGGYGALTGGAAGEVAIYNDFNFESADSIVAYVAWDGGGFRKGLAQEAGLWGDTDVSTAAGDVIELTGDGTDADSYTVAVAVFTPDALTYGATLSGDAQPTPVETDASGGFSLEAWGGVASYTLAVIGIEAFSQAHIHQGAEGTDGGVVAFLATHDPAVSGDPHTEGTLRTGDLIGALEGDWAGFLAGLADGTLYVNVHTAANPGGELRGQIDAGTDGSVYVWVPVPAGSSLFGWFGLDSESAELLADNSALTRIWWLAPTGWILDSEDLPSGLRNSIAITRGTGILVIASEDTMIQVPLVALGGLSAGLAAVDDSGVSGVASLVAYGGGTRIRVAVLGLTEGDHANHVHHGSCDQQGEIHVPLSDLSAGADGEASGATVWTDNGIDHFASGHYVAVHELVTFAVITCGDVN
ncbi:MAG: CHRD domain-containing protein [Chloroflexi bacterium]|nr:CHRD domain-containing protein [Chloroflexota bacterium]